MQARQMWLYHAVANRKFVSELLCTVINYDYIMFLNNSDTYVYIIILINNNNKSTKKHLKMNKEIGMILPQKRVNTSGVGESNNYYEDIYNIYTSLQQHSLTTPIDSTH